MKKTSVGWLCCQPRHPPMLHSWPLLPHEYQYHRQSMWTPWYQKHAADPPQVHGHSTNWSEGTTKKSWYCQDVWSIKIKFCENNKVRKPSCFLHLAKSKSWSQQRWNQNFSSNNWVSNHKVITFFIYCRQIFFLPFIWHNPMSAVLLMGQTNPEEYTKETKQNEDCLTMEKRLLPHIFHSSVTYFCIAFSFCKQVLRNRHAKIQALLLSIFQRENRTGWLEHCNWVMKRKT